MEDDGLAESLAMFDARTAKILIVEDDELVRELVTSRLKLAGYETHPTSDGRSALEAVKIFQPDAIVLDLNMPRFDGFDVLRSLKRQAQENPPPVLVLTARNSANDVRLCIALGAKDYLAKPFKDGQLLARVARLVLRRSFEPLVKTRPDDNRRAD